MKDLNLAAIDVGSNAIRLLLSRVHHSGDEPMFHKTALIRVPLRLGEDAFTTGKLSDKKIHKFVHTLHAFRHLMQVHEVVAFRACATSAMREASNAPEVIELLKEKTGIEIEIIAGQREAEIIFSTQIQQYIHINRAYLYVDVGGGSTEITMFVGKKSTASRSFNIGTVRLLNNLVADDQWKEMKRWIKHVTGSTGLDIDLIGSGGNINKAFKMLRKEDGKAIRRKELQSFHEFVDSYSMDERLRWLDLRPDRADVLPHALSIFVFIMQAADSKRIFVPKFGLSDGIVKKQYDQIRAHELETGVAGDQPFDFGM